MGSSLFAGISGLASAGKQLDVIGNNIANVNTIGFRSGRIYFGDILSQSVTGGAAAGMQVGRGVDVAAITTQFSSGSFETTANATDLAIDGDGFFIVKDADEGSYYTRAGAFHLDNEGYLVDVNSLKVQGYNITGVDPDTISNISLSGVQSEPSATTEISIGSNLDAATVAGGTFNASQTVYDSLGAIHSLKVTFQKTEGNGYWGFQSYLDNVAVAPGDQSYSGLKFDTNGVLEYVYSASNATTKGVVTGDGTVSSTTINREGQLYKDGAVTLTSVSGGDSWSISGAYANATVTRVSATELTIDLDGAGGADITLTLDGGTWPTGDTIICTIDQEEVTPRDVNLTMPTITGATIGDSGVVSWDLAGTTAEKVTGYASTSVIRTLFHDGYSSGSLKSISVTSDGVISGFFTNGQTSDISQIVLADFANTTGLKRMGKNLFGTTVESGDAVPNRPGSAGMGEISPNSLEMSNTDIATEFINMITAQRAYQASAKIVTVTDQMMAELMNIKR
ncbi:MAG: flagellar hook protein FlgE [Deltaproteobacteria bacterium]|nr:flagellar hook protein FlgE [Deltaproteobacteria bacterium]